MYFLKLTFYWCNKIQRYLQEVVPSSRTNILRSANIHHDLPETEFWTIINTLQTGLLYLEFWSTYCFFGFNNIEVNRVCIFFFDNWLLLACSRGVPSTSSLRQSLLAVAQVYPYYLSFWAYATKLQCFTWIHFFNHYLDWTFIIFGTTNRKDLTSFSKFHLIIVH